MSKDEETTDKPVDAPAEAAAAAPRQRKIVRRSAATRDNPAFSEPVTGAGAAEAAPAAAAPAAEPGPAAGAPAGDAPAVGASVAGAPAHRRFDARMPRPKPGPNDARPPRPQRPPRGGAGGGDFRPPPARPMGARPIPGGSRAPAPEGGDFRPPPARPMGARPIPGGSRAPAPEGGERFDRGERREHRPRPEGERAPRPMTPPAPVAHARPVVVPMKAHAPAPAPVKPGKPAPQPPKAPAAKPMPVYIPLARAGQVTAATKPALTPKEALAARTKAHAPKPVAKAAPKAGDSRPPSAAIDAALLQVSGDEAVQALVKAGDAAQALVDAWVGASNAAAVVEASESDAVPGSARKAARRALNVLRSRGVTIPARAHILKLDDRTEVSIEATLSPPDSTGTISVSITSKDASGRYHIAEVIVREPFGILQAASGWLTGTQIKEGRQRAIESFGVAPAPVPVEWARYRVAAARKLNAASGQVVPIGFERCGELFNPAPEAEPPHPLAAIEAEVTAERAAAAALASASLHGEPEFGTWMPDRGALDEMLQKVGERLGPEGMSDPSAVDTAIMQEMEAATDRFFSPEVREIVATRMRDAAISVRARKGDGRAGDVLAVGRAVREAGLITSPPREIPFLVGFFQKALSVMAQQGGGRLRVPVQAGPAPEAAL
jgi:hypothetical protein